MESAHYLSLIDRELSDLPWYIQEYYQAKASIPLSPATLYQYLTEYRRFLTWLMTEGLTPNRSIAEISIDRLATLRKEDILLYKSALLNRHKDSATGGVRSRASVNRSLHALSSLFKYLTEDTEDANGDPYFQRNILRKIDQVPIKETYAARAANLEHDLLLGDKDHAYLDFLAHHYQETLTPAQRRYFLRDQLRDLALNALLLGSGIRVAEAAGVNLKDLNLEQQSVRVIRKGGLVDTVPIAPWTLPYIADYLKDRDRRYRPTSREPALFLSRYRGSARRLQVSSIEKLVAKYTSAFGVRLTPHKFRHTLASKLYLATKNEQLVATQLGQNSTSATGLYTHMVETEQRKGLENL